MGETEHKEIVGLQLLRGLAAFSVMVHHAGFEIWKAFHLENPVPLGTFGVDLFFVLSGMVMWISTRSIEPGGLAARRFLVKRVLRISPMYWVVTLFLALAFATWPSLSSSDQFVHGRLWKSLLYVPQSGWPLLVVGWTLSHELLFYLIFSIKVGWKRGALPVVAILSLLGGVGVAWSDRGASDWLVLMFSPFQFEFLLGIGCGWLYERRKLPPTWVSVAALSILGLAGGVLEPSRWLLWGGISASVCLLVLNFEGRLRAASSSGRILGGSSYALYLIHLPILTVVGRMVPLALGERSGAVSRWTVLIGSLVLCEVVAIAAWKLFDEPVQTWIKRRLRSPSKMA